MKKIFKKMALCLACCTGLTMTSCSEDSPFNQWLNKVFPNLGQILSVLTGTTNAVEETAFQGDLTSCLLTYNAEAEGYLQGDATTFKGTTCVVGVNADGTYNITIPGHDVDKNTTLGDISFYYLVKDEKGKLQLGENSSVSENASLTVNGVAKSFYSLYIDCTHTSNAIDCAMSIYFGDEKTAVNVTFKGEAVATESAQ